jgi:acyl-CoA thioesterase II
MKSLIESLELERIELNLFRGYAPNAEARRIYGGHVIAQSLLAAYQTVENRLCHSLHAYFIRAGDPTVPILYEVDRARDGGSFTTRRVVAIQHGEQIFNLAASFQVAEAGFEHQSPMPPAPRPEVVPDNFEAEAAGLTEAERLDLLRRSHRDVIDMRYVDWRPQGEISIDPPHQQMWMRAAQQVPDDQRLHQVVVAYLSDLQLMGASLRPHPAAFNMPGLQSASLDHAIWFHRPCDLNRWHLYDMDSPSSAGGRGLGRGGLYAEDGTLVASTAQEGLIRYRQP